jgi:hypothetical protein
VLSFERKNVEGKGVRHIVGSIGSQPLYSNTAVSLNRVLLLPCSVATYIFNRDPAANSNQQKVKRSTVRDRNYCVGEGKGTLPSKQGTSNYAEEYKCWVGLSILSLHPLLRAQQEYQGLYQAYPVIGCGYSLDV